MLKSLLNSFLLNDNVARSNAEQIFMNLKISNPRDAVLGLLELISDDQTEIRSLASILFRGIILREPKIFDSSISPTELELIKARFLKILQIENSLHIRGKLIDCVAAIKKFGDWPELIAFIEYSAKQNSDHIRLSLQLIEKLAEYNLPSLQDHINLFLDIITASQASDNLSLKMIASKAFLSLLFEINESLQHVCMALRNFVAIMNELLNNHLYFESLELFDILLLLAKSKPNVFFQIKNELFVLLNNIINHNFESDELKIAALETMSELISTKKSTVYREYSMNLLVLSIDLINTFKESEEYLSEEIERPNENELYDDSFGADNSENRLSDNALQVFIKICELNNTKELVVSSLQIASKLMSDSNHWKFRRTAFIIVSVLVEECTSFLRPYLDSIIPAILHALHDSHLKVRYAAIFSLGCFPVNFTPDDTDTFDDDDDDDDDDDEKTNSFQDTYTAKVLPIVIEFIQNNIQHPYLLHRGLNSLKNFLDPINCKPSNVNSYISSNIIELMLQIIEADQFSLFVVEEAFTVLSNILALSESELCFTYYSRLIPIYTKTIDSVGSGASYNYDISMVKGRCLESFAIYCRKVDFSLVRDLAVKLISSGVSIVCSSSAGGMADYADPLTSYINQACVRIAGLMGDSFQPFLTNIIPALLFHISEDLPISIMFCDDDDLNAGKESPLTIQDKGSNPSSDNVFTIYKRGYGNVKLHCNTYLVTERETSCRVLYQYLSDLPRLMWIYTPDILQAISDLSTPLFSDEMYLIVGSIISESLRIFLIHCNRSPSYPIVDVSILSIVDLPSRNLSASQLAYFLSENGIQFLLSKIKYALESPESEGFITIENIDKLFSSIDSIREILLILENHWVLTTYKYADIPFSSRKPPPPPGAVISDNLLEELINTLMSICTLWINRRFASENSSSSTVQEQLENEDELWQSITDIFGWLLKLCPEQANKSPATQKLLMFTRELLNLSLSKISALGLDSASLFLSLISMSLQLTCDFIEFTQLNAFSETFYESLIQLAPIDYDIMLIAVNGIGILASNGPQEFNSYSNRSSKFLEDVLNQNIQILFEADEEFSQKLNDIILFSSFKLYLYRFENFDLQPIIQQLSHKLTSINCIPETKNFYRLFLYFVSQRDPKLLGPNNMNGPVIISLINSINATIDVSKLKVIDINLNEEMIEFWENQLIDIDTFKLLIKILKKISANVN